ncbi:MAG: MarR family transcriptional regulator [Acidibacillus sp.]|uniref:HTH marR-type domain-containing protein n=1 Tax=Sulfoacidibacillus ferrooxidans TaxID=2005001 RepID=A0A9X1V8G5_9BACL|nr:MarR family transcriptional regulator [Sulfoacidibacillus ferrooxidans]MCI0183531.1 hypothetical protein [Sulfoacidibacillus ferrooxidans]MCY0892154.1 MarR family transcriptional regulator [Acidibacillus sp.]
MIHKMRLLQLLPISLDRMHRLIRMTVKQEIHRKVGIPELRIIDFIAFRMISRHPGLTIKELSTRLGIAQSTASGMVERYERMKLIRKIINEEDRRSYRLYLPKDSEAVMKDHIQVVTDDLFATLIDQLSDAEREGLQVGLAGLLRVADEQLALFTEDTNHC